ncbi:MAG: hypothetical protein EPO24_09705 [Bacteroidetes bacterium]|nr:MAG: hypothetical protein EPO24_09705 [Bacteroidota bacterium]
MFLKACFVILICSSPAFMQGLDSSDYQNIEGNYVLTNISVDSFENFYHFELFFTKTEVDTPRFGGKIQFATDLINETVDTLCWVDFNEFYITNDSLFFNSIECFGESYEFRGHFLVPPSEFIIDYSPDPVLDGVLTHKKSNKIINQARVKFLYSPGCYRWKPTYDSNQFSHPFYYYPLLAFNKFFTLF